MTPRIEKSGFLWVIFFFGGSIAGLKKKNHTQEAGFFNSRRR
jgi:hypothetical protein